MNEQFTPSDEPGRECGDGIRSRSLSVIVPICISAGARFLATDFIICALIGRMDRILNQTECFLNFKKKSFHKTLTLHCHVYVKC